MILPLNPGESAGDDAVRRSRNRSRDIGSGSRSENASGIRAMNGCGERLPCQCPPTVLGRVADLHFTPICAMLLTASEGERHGTHARALSSLSQRPRHQRRQDQSGSTTLEVPEHRLSLLELSAGSSLQRPYHCNQRADRRYASQWQRNP